MQVICWKGLWQRHRSVLLHARLMAVAGTWQREGETANLIAGYLEDLTPLLGRLSTRGREFRVGCGVPHKKQPRRRLGCEEIPNRVGWPCLG